MSITIKDVAAAAGVSTATVSRVLSGKSPVSEEVRKRVLSAVESLEYRPNALARSLREETTKTLGLVVSNVLNPFYTAVARAVEDAASEMGYSVILCNADEDADKEDFYLDVLLQKRVDGLIISPARNKSRQLSRYAKDDVPVIFVDRSIEGLGIPTIRADGRKAIEELVEYLVRLGHERLAIVSGPPEVVSGTERLNAFLSSARKRRVTIPEEYVRLGDFRRESGRQAMQELLQLRQQPTAVFVANNLMCLGALQAAKEAECRIPEDISIASFDDVTWFELMEPPITAIAQPTQELGVMAAQMLLEQLEEDRKPESRTLEAELVIRGSCGVPRADS
jgi:LacI family transcriptional regulator